MEIITAITGRKSYRALSPEALPEGTAARIVEAGHLAPSCFNNQPWHIVASSAAAGAGEALAALREALAESNAWATKAPLIIAVAARASDDCRLEDGRDYALFDAGLCAMNMMTQATAEGLVAHPIAGYNPKKAKAALGIEKDFVLAVLIVVAKRSDGNVEDDPILMPWQKTGESAPRNRKPLSDVVRFV